MRKNDLTRAEQRWRRRGLFGQRQRPRRWPWWLLLLLVAILLFVFHKRLF